MKFTEYPKVISLEKDQTFLIDGGGAGTSQIEAEDAYLALAETVDADPAVVHRNIYRGKNLGNTFTDEQKAAIADGSFKDLYVGDYWENGSIKWAICDINYWVNVNLTSIPNHLVMMPYKELYTQQMNSTDTTSTGYLGSLMKTSGLTNALNLVNGFFGEDFILEHKASLTNSVHENSVKTISNVSTKIDLPTEQMVYGYPQMDNFMSMQWYTTATDSAKQLAIFRLFPEFITTCTGAFWLRNVANGIRFAIANIYGNFPSEGNPTNYYGVRPVFGITG